MNLLTQDEIKYFQTHQYEITPELLEALRELGKPGKQQALDILELQKTDDHYYLDAYGEKISYFGNRTAKKPYTKLKLSDIHYIEIERCYEDALYFIRNYVKVMTSKGIDFLDFREYQERLLKLLMRDDVTGLLALQPRQSGKSVVTGTWMAWVFTFETDVNIGIVANKGGMAREFLDKCKNMLTNLPVWLKPGVLVWNKGSIKSEANNSILTDVPGDSAFRGWTINYLVIDETDWIAPNKFKALTDSILPAQAALAKRKSIFLTTPNGKQQFYELWKDAGYTHEESKNNYIKFDLDWRDVPRLKADGTTWDPEEFKKYTLAREGEPAWYQNYECITGDCEINIFDKLNKIKSKIKIESLNEIINNSQI